MNARVRDIWQSVRASYWFIPSILIILSIVLAFALDPFDRALSAQTVRTIGGIYSGGASGARSILTTIASSIMTVTGVTFSITIVGLQLTSAQFGQRLLRSFMRDAGNQIVLGTLLATFLYTLLVLRTIRSGTDGTDYVPYISVTLGIILALLSVALLVYFIHHVAQSIQVSNVVAKISHQIEKELARQSADDDQTSMSDERPSLDEQLIRLGIAIDAGIPILGTTDGYVQAIDMESLFRSARGHKSIVRIERLTGEYAMVDEPLVTVWSLDPAAAQKGELEAAVRSAFVFGWSPTIEQDVGFLFHQLVEIGVRALSPSLNDPFTAVACLDRLTSALLRLAEHPLHPLNHYGEDGALYLAAQEATFTDMARRVFERFTEYGCSHLIVTLRLLSSIASLAPHAHTTAERDTLIAAAAMVHRQTATQLGLTAALDQVEARYRTVQQTLASGD